MTKSIKKSSKCQRIYKIKIVIFSKNSKTLQNLIKSVKRYSKCQSVSKNASKVIKNVKKHPKCQLSIKSIQSESIKYPKYQYQPKISSSTKSININQKYQYQQKVSISPKLSISTKVSIFEQN